MALEEKERTGMKRQLLMAAPFAECFALSRSRSARACIRSAHVCLAILLFPLLIPALAFADSSAIIIQGIAGSDEFDAKYMKWATDLQKALVEDLGFSKENVILLRGDGSKKPAVEKAFADLKPKVKKEDTFLLFLVGSGSFDAEYKLSLSGPDMTGSEYAKLIDSLEPARSVIIAGTTSAGGLFEKAAARNRIILASSRSGEKEEGTVFYDHFLAGLKGATADEDKDKKVTVWEAFKYATAGVERHYKEKTNLQTEHAEMVVAVGGTKVTPAISEQEAPVLARVTALNADRAVTVADPKLQALLNEKKMIDSKIEALRLDKGILPVAEYENRLEALVLELARKNQQIREQERR
jgi:hypothetical protein